MENIWPRLLLVACVFNQLSVTINIPTIQIPRINRINPHTHGSTQIPINTIELAHMAAIAANVRICPTRSIIPGQRKVPATKPMKYIDIMKPMVVSVNPSSTPRNARSVPWSPLPNSRIPIPSNKLETVMMVFAIRLIVTKMY